MNYHTKVLLERIIFLEESQLEKEEHELKGSPGGTLVVRSRKKRIYYYHRNKNSEKGITRDKSLIYSLARKTFLSTSISIRKKNLALLKKCLSNISTTTPFPYSKYNSPLLNNIMYNQTECEWLSENASCNEYKKENLIYKTASGIYVRSKSERIIADRLFYYGVIFKYEPAFDTGKGVVFPDFLILKKDLSLLIWEHNGLSNDKAYNYRSKEKIELYNNAGFYQHHNLICTEEREILDVKAIDDIIVRFILL